MRSSKHIALLSLCLMAAGFLATLPFSSIWWVRFLQAGFEAGLVGGLADWFAVTALFRHPLGIPIPHTALLPKNRKRVTRALVDTVENELLSKESIRTKLDQFSISTKMLDAADHYLDAPDVQQALVSMCIHIVKEVPLAPVVPLLEREIRHQAHALDMQKLLGTGIRYGIAQQWDEKAFDMLLDMAEQVVYQPKTVAKMGSMATEALAHFQTNGFMQFALNAFVGFVSEEKLGHTIQQFLLQRLAELRMEGHPTRESILQAVREHLTALPEQEQTMHKLNSWKTDMIEKLQLAPRLETMLEQLRENVLRLLAEETFAERVLVPMLRRSIQRVRNNETLVTRIETFIHDKLSSSIEKHHHKIGSLIQENLDRYDDATLIALMEDKLGKDLQWIRVNGALCGFLIGLVLATIRFFAG